MQTTQIAVRFEEKAGGINLLVTKLDQGKELQ